MLGVLKRDFKVKHKRDVLRKHKGCCKSVWLTVLSVAGRDLENAVIPQIVVVALKA